MCISVSLLLCVLLKDRDYIIHLSITHTSHNACQSGCSTNVYEMGEDILEIVFVIRTLGDKRSNGSLKMYQKVDQILGTWKLVRNGEMGFNLQESSSGFFPQIQRPTV